jgi:hypothetical protein
MRDGRINTDPRELTILYKKPSSLRITTAHLQLGIHRDLKFA